MYERICRNTSAKEDEDQKLCTIVAAAVHDVGHGPFSHTMEEILTENGIPFDHENMTLRYIVEQDSPINRFLREADKKLPERIAAFFDQERRPADHWSYKIVSSQLDADRLDYLQRDSLFAGIKGQGFDLERILDLLCSSDGKRIAVERGAMEAIEAYLMTLDLLYRSIYYHHTVRAATRMLLSLFKRAVFLRRNGDRTVFLEADPLAALVDQGEKIPISEYSRLTEINAWACIATWQSHTDQILRELSGRLLERKLFKAIDLPDMGYEELKAFEEKAREITTKLYAGFPADAAQYFVAYDEPSRTSYKTYDWRPESSDDSIWLVEDDGQEHPLEADEDSTIVQAFKNKRYFPRLIVPPEVRALMPR
jgi:HD superfamily phosphohydrolase